MILATSNQFRMGFWTSSGGIYWWLVSIFLNLLTKAKYTFYLGACSYFLKGEGAVFYYRLAYVTFVAFPHLPGHLLGLGSLHLYP